MTVVRLQEDAPWAEHGLTSDQAAACRHRTGADRARPRLGLWRLRDNGLGGAARTGPRHGPVEVRVQPKTPIDRLRFLPGYARRPRGWRQDRVDAGERPVIFDRFGMSCFGR
ncbi:hypothetical protein SAMN06265355_11453 [Actinomadura mexicana]|uniref:Uncharacterized protein n=1 Tax=Actinomadura mexicana TaxID=134959 RepID=A0A239D966_9ACTN|nr:hypothetical protein SAMN06265355_11453 [Actinomadura mexicana]